MKAGLELTDVPEGFLIPIVATLGVVGNLGKDQFLNRCVELTVDSVDTESPSTKLKNKEQKTKKN